MLRLFVAIALPASLKKELSLIPEEVGKFFKSAKWVSPESVHLTLKFLGSCPEDLVPKIKEGLSANTKGVKPFPFELGNLGGFPSLKRVRVFWVGVKRGEEELAALQKQVERALLPLGFEKENRKFHAHFTLARLRIPQNLEQIVSQLEGDKLSPKLSREIEADKIILFQSTLTPRGPIYTSLAQFPLKGE